MSSLIRVGNRFNLDHEGFFTEVHHPQRKRSRIHRNKFRKIALGVLFCVILQHRSGKSCPVSIQTNIKVIPNILFQRRPLRSASARIHQIRLQEMIVALHRVYLEPDGPIFNTLIQVISSPISLDAALNKSSKDYPQAIQTIGDALTNIIARLTEFMVKNFRRIFRSILVFFCSQKMALLEQENCQLYPL